MEKKDAVLNRKIDIDIAKGIGIIMVVWAHARGPFSLYINQFHMPFFFFVSGYLYSYKGQEFFAYTKKKVTSLLIPFWWWNLLLYPIFFVLFYWGNWNIGTAIKEVLEIVLTVNKVAFLGPTWFLAALFWVSILVHLYMCKCNFKYKDVLLFILGIVICVTGFYIVLPYKMSRTLILTLFYISGYLYKKHLHDRLKNVHKNILACVGGVIYVLIASNNTADMSGHVYTYKLAFVVGAFLATGFVLRVSKWMAECKLLSRVSNHIAYLGKNSIYLVIWHVLAFRFTIIIQMFVCGAGIKDITAFPVYDASGLWWLMYVFTGIYGTLLWKYILEHNPLTHLIKKLYMI